MISKVHNVNGYEISETETIRSQDLRRFAVTKPGRRKPYVVTFQTRAARRAGCSCPAGRNQLGCKHVAMCAQLFA